MVTPVGTVRNPERPALSGCIPGHGAGEWSHVSSAARAGVGLREAPPMDLFPALPRESWAPTKETLHRFLQIVGKARLEASVRRNHWWNVP